MISKGRVTALYNLAGPESYAPVNRVEADNVRDGNTDAVGRNTVREPHIGGGSSQNV